MSSPITYDATGHLSNQGAFRSGRPWGRVIHTLECEAKPNIARELSAPGGYLDNQGLAPHGMSDPTQRVRACNTNRIGGHVGGRANPHVVGYEVSGRAKWTPQEWLDGGNRQAALESDARLIAWDCVQDGWSREEATRWLSGAQIKQNYAGGPIVRGLLEHNDVSEFIGGTNHWDPGEFVSEWFVGRIGAYYDEYSGGAPVTTPSPIPVPEEDDEMKLTTVKDNQNGVVYAYDRRTFIHIKDPKHWELLVGAGFIEDADSPAKNPWDIEWIRGQIEAWGGHVDAFVPSGK